MKKTILVMVAALFVAGTTMAQTKSKTPPAKKTETSEKVAKEKLTSEQKAQRGVDKLNAACGLTDDQKTKIYALNLERVKKAEALRGENKGKKTEEEKAKMKEQIKPINKDYRAKVKALLTKEQIEKLKAKHKEHKDAKDKSAEELIPVED
jgi:protein CpxP